jgi:hypothetical protein
MGLLALGIPQAKLVGVVIATAILLPILIGILFWFTRSPGSHDSAEGKSEDRLDNPFGDED